MARGRSINRLRLLLLWGIAISVPFSAEAFSGREHRDIANAALSLALLHVRSNQPANCGDAAGPCAPVLAVGAELLHPVAPLHSFGDLTRAVDWFQGPEILTYEVAWHHVDQRRKLSRLILHGLALHRNRAHFQVEALNSYARFHDQAIVFARHHNETRALYSEAVALHFLHDFFAAGHFVTPRSGFQDAVAGSLHDKYNIEGVDVAVNIPKVGPWKQLVDELHDMPFHGDLFTIDANDVDAFKAVDGKSFRAGGDECLTQISAQRVLLVLASAESLVEVLESTTPVLPDYIIDVCFEPRSAKRIGTSSKPDPTSRRGPDGGVGVTSTKAGWPRLVGPCETSEALPLARYRLNAARLGGLHGIYPASGFQIMALAGRGFHSNDHRRIIDLNWIVGASEPTGSLHVRENDKDTGDVFQNHRQFSFLAAHASLVRGQRFRAIGFGSEYGLDIPVMQPFSFALFSSVRRYSFADARKYRLDYGGKVSVGAQVANLTLSLEQGHHVGADGRLRREVFILPGVDVTLSNSWLRDLIRRAPAPCCKSQ
jgi:hypothetical protein